MRYQRADMGFDAAHTGTSNDVNHGGRLERFELNRKTHHFAIKALASGSPGCSEMTHSAAFSYSTPSVRCISVSSGRRNFASQSCTYAR